MGADEEGDVARLRRQMLAAVDQQRGAGHRLGEAGIVDVRLEIAAVADTPDETEGVGEIDLTQRPRPSPGR